MKKIEIVCILLLYFSAAVSLSDSLNTIALYGAIPLSFVFSFYSGNSLRYSKYVKCLLVLILWISFTYLGATYMQEANAQMKNLLGVFVLSVTLVNLSNNKYCIPWLYGVFVILFIQALIYANNHILVGGFDSATDRLNDEKLNANTVAYYTFFVTFAFYELGNSFLIKRKIVARVFRICFLGMYIVSFIVALLTASRQVIVIQVPLLALLTYIRYIKGASIRRKLAFVVIASIVCLSSITGIVDAYDNSFLKLRSEQNVKEDVRTVLLKDAIEVGLHHPLIGVGPGNYVQFSFNKHFSHCTYTELFANTGLPGVLIYIYLLFLFVKSQWARMRRYQDRTYLVFLLCGIIYLFDNFFYVFYVDLWLIGFFMLLASHSECYYKINRYEVVR